MLSPHVVVEKRFIHRCVRRDPRSLGRGRRRRFHNDLKLLKMIETTKQFLASCRDNSLLCAISPLVAAFLHRLGDGSETCADLPFSAAILHRFGG